MPGKYECDNCSESFKTKELLKEHIKTTKRKPNICEVC